MLYRKKPVVVEAIKFEDTSECLVALSNQLKLDPVRVSYAEAANPVLKINTLEGEMTGKIGDYIIKGVNGEFYPIKAEIFLETYERVGSVH